MHHGESLTCLGSSKLPEPAILNGEQSIISHIKLFFTNQLCQYFCIILCRTLKVNWEEKKQQTNKAIKKLRCSSGNVCGEQHDETVAVFIHKGLAA